MTLETLLKDEDLKRCVDFHGHLCPGLAIGFVASRDGLLRLRETRADDEEIVTVVGTDACCADAVQVMMGSTFGKGNFIFKDHGKVVMTFISRSSEQAFRYSLKHGVISLSERHRDLVARVIHEAASEDEISEFWRLHHLKAGDILNTSPDELFHITRAAVPMPDTAEIHPSVPCGICGEPVMQTRLVDYRGQQVCMECLEKKDRPAVSS